MFSNTPLIRDATLALNTAGTVSHEFYFPRAARIKRYFAVPQAAQAAHATIVDTVTFTDKGVSGAGSTVLATLTNDSDLADSTTRESGAWAAAVVKQVNTEDRPTGGTAATNEADAIAAGSVIEVAVTGAGSTPSANWFTVGIEFEWST